ncbi:MAG: hypothetical protein ACRDRY_07550 [Pseudonocardiaceae bacterium]
MADRRVALDASFLYADALTTPMHVGAVSLETLAALIGESPDEAVSER